MTHSLASAFALYFAVDLSTEAGLLSLQIHHTLWFGASQRRVLNLRYAVELFFVCFPFSPDARRHGAQGMVGAFQQ
jgi:hypothetical protein